MTIRIQAAVKAAVTASVLLGNILGSDANGAVDELSLVQMSAAQAEQETAQLRDELDDELADVFDAHGRNATSLLALGLPGVKSMKDQIKEAAKFTMPTPEKGYHKKVVKAMPGFEADCKSKAYATEEDCATANKLLTMMAKNTEGPEPMWTWHGHLRTMLGIHFWLYTPGTMLCFTMLDMDKNKGITYEEMTKLFGTQAMAAFNPAWKFMDPDGDGSMTREELHKYLRAVILVRGVLPELDGIDPQADTKKCLNMAHRVLSPPAAPTKRMRFYPKLLSIAGIFVGAIALHCLFCTRGSRKAVDMDQPAEEMAEKDPDSKK